MKQYTVYYRPNGIYEKEEKELVLASTVNDAYTKFMEKHNWSVYTAYVSHYTTQTGSVHYLKGALTR